MFGPDVKASLTIDELKQLVEGVRYVEAMLNHPVNKESGAASLSDLRAVFYKSAVARIDIAEGAFLQRDMVCELKAGGGGITPDQLPLYLGKRFIRTVKAGKKIQKEDFADV
jgi:N-acetylneuraminate synthase